MPWLLGKHTRTKQPKSGARIDIQNPLNLSILDAFNGPDFGIRSAFGRKPYSSAPVTLTGTKGGISASATTQAIVYDLEWGESGPHSAIILASILDISSTVSFCWKSGTAVPLQIAGLDVRAVTWNSQTAANYKPTSSPTPTLDVFVFNRVSMSSLELWMNGSLVTTVTGLSSYGTTANRLAFLGSEGDLELCTSSKGSIALAALWNRGLSPLEVKKLSANPWQIFEPDLLPVWIPAGGAPQLLVPISDISAGGWTPSSGSDLYAMLDESAYSDTDYIVSSTPSTCEMRVTTATDPAVSTGHVLRYRLLAGTGSIAVALKQGSTTIASFGPHALTGSAQDFEQTLSGGEADSITDYSDLRVVFTAS